jgi:hypothetical protein
MKVFLVGVVPNSAHGACGEREFRVEREMRDRESVGSEVKREIERGSGLRGEKVGDKRRG